MTVDFLKMMRKLAYPVCIASAKCNNHHYAITVSSVTSISLDPPSLLVCINKESSFNEALRIGAPLNINFLSPAQKEIASVCSSKENVEKRFDNNLWSFDVNGSSFLKNSIAVAFGEVVDIVSYASHNIVILRTEKVILDDKEQPDPLLYCNGAYASLGMVDGENN